LIRLLRATASALSNGKPVLGRLLLAVLVSGTSIESAFAQSDEDFFLEGPAPPEPPDGEPQPPPAGEMPLPSGPPAPAPGPGPALQPVPGGSVFPSVVPEVDQITSSVLNFDAEPLTLSAGAPGVPGPAPSPYARSDVWIGEIVIEFVPGEPSFATFDSLDESYDLKALDGFLATLSGRQTFLFRMPRKRDARAMLFALENDPRFLSVQHNFAYDLSAGLSQYALDVIGIAPDAFRSGGSGMRVAMIDTAVDTTHPDLKHARIAQLSVYKQKGQGAASHGTAIASILGGSGTLRGIAPQVQIIAIEAFRQTPKDRYNGRSSSFHLSKALNRAHEHRAHVVNMSLTGPKDPILNRTLRQLWETGTIVVAAAGNGGKNAHPAFPAAYDGVLAVTATDSSDNLYKQANRGDYIFLSAPGVNILTAATDQGYGLSTGTSMAAAHVSGLIALLLEKYPTLEGEALIDLLRTTSVDLGRPGRDPDFGFGRLNASALLH